MIEIIAVLLVISIIAAAAVISGGYSTSDYDLTSQAGIIKGHLRYAQARAMNTDIVWGIDFSSAKTYSLFKYTGRSNVPVDLPGEASSTVVFQDENGNPTGMTVTVATVSFDSWGKPYTNASATPPPAANDINIIVTYNETESETIVITKNTGFIP